MEAAIVHRRVVGHQPASLSRDLTVLFVLAVRLAVGRFRHGRAASRYARLECAVEALQADVLRFRISCDDSVRHSYRASKVRVQFEMSDNVQAVNARERVVRFSVRYASKAEDVPFDRRAVMAKILVGAPRVDCRRAIVHSRRALLDGCLRRARGLKW